MFSTRGYMLDISRDKVPTMATLYRIVELLQRLGYNQFQLYTEHTFAYTEHEDVWHAASPMTAAEVRALDTYCAARGIELVANQNSFGHLERWLRLPRYNVLAELPRGGAPLPWGGVKTYPTALCPTDPRSVALLESWYDELLPNFTSSWFNVGCDEVFDLRAPDCRSAAAIATVGEGRVYLDFLLKIHALAAARGKRIQFWGDIILHHSECIDALPRDVLALAWGYEADHPFDTQCAAFAAAGVPFYVCPGTSAWQSISGRVANMMANIDNAVCAGARHGAIGFLLTDWGDCGHWQPFAASLPGLVYGAARAQGRVMDEAGLIDALNEVMGVPLGDVLVRLGNIYRLSGAERGNATELFQMLYRGATYPRPAGMTDACLRAVEDAVTACAHVAQQRGVAADNGWARDIDWMCTLYSHLFATRRGTADRAAFAEQFRDAWLRDNRPGGLDDSFSKFPA